MCSSRKYPYSPHRRDWKFQGGGGSQKTKKLKVMYEANLEFSEGLGGGIKGQIPYMDWGGMNIFWNHTIKQKFTILSLSFPLVLLCNWKNLNNGSHLEKPTFSTTDHFEQSCCCWQTQDCKCLFTMQSCLYSAVLEGLNCPCGLKDTEPYCVSLCFPASIREAKLNFCFPSV